MDRPRPPFDIGPEVTDLVLAIGDSGFTAQISADNWLMVGAPVTVWREPNQGPWEGRVLAFSRALYSRATWTLASGDKREHKFFSKPDEQFVMGHTFPVKMAAHSWTATVVECVHATRVLISFTIQSGAARRRDFFRIGQLDGYAKPTENDMVALYALPPITDP